MKCGQVFCLKLFASTKRLVWRLSASFDNSSSVQTSVYWFETISHFGKKDQSDKLTNSFLFWNFPQVFATKHLVRRLSASFGCPNGQLIFSPATRRGISKWNRTRTRCWEWNPPRAQWVRNGTLQSCIRANLSLTICPLGKNAATARWETRGDKIATDWNKKRAAKFFETRHRRVLCLPK